MRSKVYCAILYPKEDVAEKLLLAVKIGGMKMSFGIVRVIKFKAGGVKGIEIHDRRTKDRVSHTNKDINWERSHLNYDLHEEQNHSLTQAVKIRIKALDLKKAVRKDAVVMAQVLVTSDHDFFENITPEKQQQFFKDSYAFLAHRYGIENIVSATVHLDEHTPHMHLNFVPVTADGRLSAKSILTKKTLSEQHTDFYNQVGKQYDLERGIKDSLNKNIEMARYKALTATQEALDATQRAQAVQDTVELMNAEYEAKKAYIRECEESSKPSYALPSYAKESIRTKGILKKRVVEAFVTVPKEKWIERRVCDYERYGIENAIKTFEKTIESYKDSATEKNIQNLKNEIENLKTENKKLDHKILILKQEKNILANRLDEKNTQYLEKTKECKKLNEKLEKVLKQCPDIVKQIFMNEWTKIEKPQKRKQYEYEMEM